MKIFLFIVASFYSFQNLKIFSEAFSAPLSSFSSWHSQKFYRNRTQLQASKNDIDQSPDMKEREPWDVLRFVGQSSKFVRPPSIPFIGGTKGGSKRKVLPGEIIWSSASKQNNIFDFAPLDDVVMGGASSSNIDNNTGIWKGTVTDKNNGGFVGIRSTPFKSNISLDMSKCTGVELRLRLGDGKRFKFVARDSLDFNGISWTTAFDAPKEEQGILSLFGSSQATDEDKIKGRSVRIPFKKMIPTIFARTVSEKTFDIENVVGFQLVYSKFEFEGELNANFDLGDFALQVMDVRAY